MNYDDALLENNLELPVIQRNDGCYQTGYNWVGICHNSSAKVLLHVFSSSQATKIGKWIQGIL